MHLFLILSCFTKMQQPYGKNGEGNSRVLLATEPVRTIWIPLINPF
jgi:hypothetical protein